MTQSTHTEKHPLLHLVSVIRTRFAYLIGIGLLLGCGLMHVAHAEFVVPLPVMDEKPSASGHVQTAIVAGGCFWGVQGVFQHVRGVIDVVSGYTGGTADTASYDRVREGDTGHAESVKITYDASQITYGRLLQIFFSVVHDPTQLDRQGPDYGPRYRSALFPTNDMQRRIAQEYIAQLDRSGVFSVPVVTRIESFNGFYPAEEYHQNFLARNPGYDYIVIHDLPKVAALRSLFPDIYNEQTLGNLAFNAALMKSEH